MGNNKKNLVGVLRGLADASLLVGFACVLITKEITWFIVLVGCNLTLFALGEAINHKENFYYWCASVGGIICSLPCLFILLTADMYAPSHILFFISIFGMMFSFLSITYARFPDIFKAIDDFWKG